MARHKDPEFKKEDLLRMIVEWKAEGQMHNTVIANIKELGYSIDYAYALLREAKPLIMETLKDLAKDRIENNEV
jgi:valyl-tRNA synthetase